MHVPAISTRRGFTLAEALIASVVLAMAITAIVMPFTLGAQNELVDARRTTALNLAEGLMEEIISKPFYDPDGPSKPGPEAGETDRSRFDNIDDYDGFVEKAGQIRNLQGEAITAPAAKGLSRRAYVTYVYVSGQDMAQEATFARVVVKVNYGKDTIVLLTRLVYAAP